MPLLDALLSVIAPHNCLVCGHEGNLLCAWCTPDAFPALPSRCYSCKHLSADYAVCSRCRRHSPLKHVWIRTGYDQTAKKLLHDYKFARTRSAATVITSTLEDVLPYLTPETLVVPVPTATSHVRVRGYDHAALLARLLARRYRLEWLRAVTRLDQHRQVGANKHLRHSQIQQAFMVTKPACIKGAHILLIDDIVTTGATLEAVGSALKQAGAQTVDAVAFAQKQ